MGLIRGALHLATYGAVSAKSKKQRMASMQLAAMQGKSEAEIRAAGGRDFDFVNRDRGLRIARQSALADRPAALYVPSEPVSYYPVRVPGSGLLHLVYGEAPGMPTLCGNSDVQDVLEALGIVDVTCGICKMTAGDCEGPPQSPLILAGSCPRCSRDVVWYTETHKTPVHVATGKFACEPDEVSQEGAGITSELERLTALHESGALDDEEFRAAKARIIGGS